MEPNKQKQKILVLMRGLPGSGKSTKAKKIAGNQGIIFSTDDFFMKNGKYQYDPKMIVQNHKKNFLRTVQALKAQKPLIIIDNTNIKLWQMKKYVQTGLQYKYEIKIQQPQTHWAFNYKQCAKKNTHEVPQDTCKKMLDNYETFNNIQDIISAKQYNKRKN